MSLSDTYLNPSDNSYNPEVNANPSPADKYVEPTEICGNCAHSRPHESDSLTCHRYPPVDGRRAVVSSNDTCGEFRLNKNLAQKRYEKLAAAIDQKREERRNENSRKPYMGYLCDKSDYVISGYRLICTCSACPEQYAVFDDKTGLPVGYLRLRHGHFCAYVPDCSGLCVYEFDTRGDGTFEDSERTAQLRKAVKAIQRHLKTAAKAARQRRNG